MSVPVNYIDPFAGSCAVWLACPGWGELMTAPVPYFGGKSRAAALVWERFGVGPGDPCPKVATGNDINGFVCNFFRAVAADPEAVARWADWPVNETDLHSRHRWLLKTLPLLRARLEADPSNYDARIAGWWAWGASCWIGSGWCEPNTRAGRGVRSGTMRQQLPDLGGSCKGDARFANVGKGVNGGAMREQLPDLAGGSGTHPAAGHGVHSKAARTRLYDVFAELSRRLRYMRFACGDWQRICTDAVTHRHGLTAVFLDPPYEGYEHLYSSAKTEGETLSARVRTWALEAGRRDDMRIILCGYEGEHNALEAVGWDKVAWKAKGGFANQSGDKNENAQRERLWCSPACLRPGVNAGQLSLLRVT